MGEQLKGHAATSDREEMQRRAAALLDGKLGAGPAPACAWAPGRCTIVGEHVDYAGGRVLAMAIDLGVAVALRPSHDGVMRVVSGKRRVERRAMVMAGDMADRVIAAALAAGELRGTARPLEVAIMATLPESAGLASSAAVICAVLSAALLLQGESASAEAMVRLALHAERDIVQVPCGPLDPHVVVEAPADGALLLDCREEQSRPIPWPWEDVEVCVCATGETHDVGGAEYGRRRAEVEQALHALGAATCQQVAETALRNAEIPEPALRRLRHVVSEDARAVAAEQALRSGDAEALGRCISASHRSLRGDQQVSTPMLDRVVDAAEQVEGCLGARLVGAGFGGSVMALTRAAGAAACAAAMAAAAGVDASSTWNLRPAPGMAALATGAIVSG